MSDRISTREAAAILGVTRQRVHQLVRERWLMPKRVGNQYTFLRGEVERLASARAEKRGKK